MTTERPACGLASLLSMSCRDRAEAFARSLQMRLHTLGLGHAAAAPDHPPPAADSASSAVDEDSAPTGAAAALPDDLQGKAAAAAASSWAPGAPPPRPPLRLGSSSDSDLYYDFDMDPESPGSPAEDALEVVVAASLRQQQSPPSPRAAEPESGLTSSHFGTSPDSDSSDSLDPEAFVSPSSSPGWSSAPAAPRRRPSPSSSSVKCNGHVPSPPLGDTEAPARRRHRNICTEGEDDAAFVRLEAGSFSSSEKTRPFGNELGSFRSKACDEEQCLVPKRSFNDSILASESEACADSSRHRSTGASDHVDDTASRRYARDVSAAVNLDSGNEEEIELLPSDDSSTANPPGEDNTETDGLSFTIADDREQFSDYVYGDTLEYSQKEESPKHFPREVQDQVTFSSGLPPDDECFPRDWPSQPCQESEISDDVQSAQAEMGILPRRPSWESDGNTVCGRITIIINQEDNLMNGTSDRDVITIKRIHEAKDNEVPSLAKSQEQLEPAPEKSSEAKTENSSLEPKAVENDEDEENPRLRLRRCSSLKTGKTPPGTPSRKKIVRFADVLGLDLADVRTFLDEIPKIPRSAYDDLQDADLSLGSPANPVVASTFPVPPGHESDLAMNLSMIQPCKILMPMFQQPGGQPDFLERIRTKFVCLENAVVKDPAMFSIGGVVRVRNLDFQKSVFIRYSIDNWGTFADLQATYVANSCDGFSDKFSFVLFAHTLSVGQRLEFAIRFQTANGQYWDSNGGANYAFQCLPACSPTPYMEMPSPEDRWGTFY